MVRRKFGARAAVHIGIIKDALSSGFCNKHKLRIVNMNSVQEEMAPKTAAAVV